MDDAKLNFFLTNSPYLKVLELNNTPAGFLIALSENETAYNSPNFQYFVQRHNYFAYIDRIAIAEHARGQGWGNALYEVVEQWARNNNKVSLCAEVNSIPDNAPSRRFHQRRGFNEIAYCRPYGPDSEVVMLEKILA